jgi:hypothetical protein
MPERAVFKSCGACRTAWSSWEDFSADPRLHLLGLQAIAGVPDASLLVFEHSCGSSVSVLARRLRYLLPEHPAAGFPSLRGTDQCAGHCLQLGDLEPCSRNCRNARDRALLSLITDFQAARDRRTH